MTQAATNLAIRVNRAAKPYLYKQKATSLDVPYRGGGSIDAAAADLPPGCSKTSRRHADRVGVPGNLRFRSLTGFPEKYGLSNSDISGGIIALEQYRRH